MASRANVEPPTFTPSPYGLLNAADSRSPTDPHWRAGVTYESWCGSASTTYDQCVAVTGTGGAPIPADKTGTHEHEVRGATSFTVYARLDCSVTGFWNGAENEVRRALDRSEQFQVERTFWTGIADAQEIVFPHLAADAEIVDVNNVRPVVLQTAAVDVTGGPHHPVIGLGYLEEAIADCYGGEGVIHVPLTLLPSLVNHRLVTRVGSQLRTTTVGNLVVAGGGYLGSGPDGTPATNATAWMYATGPVFVYRSDVDTWDREESIDRDKNVLEMIAERTYVLGWDCCHFATNITKAE